MLLAAAVLIVAAIGFRFDARHSGLYPLSGVVTGFDLTSNSVIVMDASGGIWCFAGIEDWHVGDIAAFIVDSYGTDEVVDDRIVSVRYAG